MTHNPAILEALAAVIGNGRLSNLTSNQIAAAVLELVTPKRLVWGGDTAKYGPWYYTAYDTYHGDDVLWIFGWSNYPSWEYSSDDGVYFDTEALAQAAAQAHADAAHWANTPLGKILTEDNANG